MHTHASRTSTKRSAGRLARAGERVRLRLRDALRRRGAGGPRRGERAEGGGTETRRAHGRELSVSREHGARGGDLQEDYGVARDGRDCGMLRLTIPPSPSRLRLACTGGSSGANAVFVAVQRGRVEVIPGGLAGIAAGCERISMLGWDVGAKLVVHVDDTP